MKLTVTFLLCLCLVAPVAAVTYSEEYYRIGNYSNSIYTHSLMKYEKYYTTYNFVATSEGLISAYELRRQTILVEKQNELLERQLNSTLVCTKPGPNYCSEYRWVIV